jgi:hypothetical protein
LKRNKTYSSFSEVRPTIRNKPSGLVDNWPQVLAKTSAANHRRPSAPTPSTSSPSFTLTPSTPSSSFTLTPSTPLSSLSLAPSTPSPSTSYWQAPLPLVVSDAGSFDPPMSTSDTVIPFFGQQSFPFHPNAQNPQSINDISQIFQTTPGFDILPRKYKDEAGKVQIPGLKDLPPSIQSKFRNTFIRHIIKLIFSDTSPWSNPSLSVYQQEFDYVYSPLRYRLHVDDAAVIPVTILICRQTHVSILKTLIRRPTVNWACFEAKSVARLSQRSLGTSPVNIRNAC